MIAWALPYLTSNATSFSITAVAINSNLSSIHTYGPFSLAHWNFHVNVSASINNNVPASSVQQFSATITNILPYTELVLRHRHTDTASSCHFKVCCHCASCRRRSAGIGQRCRPREHKRRRFGICIHEAGFLHFLPLVPQALSAPVVAINNNGTLTVSWLLPSPLPGVITRYDLQATSPSRRGSSTIVYSGLATSVALSLPSNTVFSVRAVTSAGAGPFSSSSVAPPQASSSTTITSQPYFYAPFAAGCLLLLLLVVLFYRKYRAQKRFNAMDAVFVPPEVDEWEYDPAGINMGDKLGAGAFGIVMAATAMNARPDLPGRVNVAIKVTHAHIFVVILYLMLILTDAC